MFYRVKIGNDFAFGCLRWRKVIQAKNQLKSKRIYQGKLK